MTGRTSNWITALSPNWLTVGLMFAVIIGLIIVRTMPSQPTRLVIASQTGHPEMVEKILSSGVSPNAVSGTNTALITAIRHGKLSVVNVLLAHGADANLDGGTGIPPIMWAVRGGDPELVRALIQAGADPNRKNAEGKTALDEARNSPELLKLLSKKR